MLEDAAACGLAEDAEGLSHLHHVHVELRDRERLDVRPARGIARGLAGEQVIEGAAAASRPVNGSPRPHALRSVAIIDVWRCSSLITIPSSTHGETMIAGTR